MEVKGTFGSVTALRVVCEFVIVIVTEVHSGQRLAIGAFKLSVLIEEFEVDSTRVVLFGIALSYIFISIRIYHWEDSRSKKDKRLDGLPQRVNC